MKLSTLLNINPNSITSIVGSGGKTTLMFHLAEEMREHGKVLVTTTTKIYVPEKLQYDHLILVDCFSGDCLAGDKLRDSDNKVHHRIHNGIYVYGKEINEDNKLTSIDEKNLGQLAKNFDFTFIEADGSKKKPLKGWRDDEPVVTEYTTDTIGVVDGQGLGLEINEDNIHRLDKFLGSHEGNVKEEDFLEVIFNSKGLFNHSRGRKILFINRVDNDEIRESISKLISEIINKNMTEKLLGKVVIGSLANKKFKVIDFDE